MSALNSDLEAIQSAWDKDTDKGRDEDGTRALCASVRGIFKL